MAAWPRVTASGMGSTAAERDSHMDKGRGGSEERRMAAQDRLRPA